MAGSISALCPSTAPITRPTVRTGDTKFVVITYDDRPEITLDDIISTSAIDCLGRFVSEMTYYVSSGTLNLTKPNQTTLDDST